MSLSVREKMRAIEMLKLLRKLNVIDDKDLDEYLSILISEKFDEMLTRLEESKAPIGKIYERS